MLKYIALKEKASRWNQRQLKRGYRSLHEPDLIEHIAQLLITRLKYEYFPGSQGCKGSYLSIDHIVNRQAIMSPKYWNYLTDTEKLEWLEFLNEWRDICQLGHGHIWIASGLQCKANLEVIPKRGNAKKCNLLPMPLFLGLSI